MQLEQQLIEHPPLAAIQLSPQASEAGAALTATYGGLRCQWCIPHRPGSCVSVTVSAHRQQVTATARVVRCDLDEHGYLFELRFLDPEQAFAMRMMEQLCHIRRYQTQVGRHEGRWLDGNQAAREWIERFADDFPAA